MMRPRGRPPTPSARSIASEPVESVSTFILALLPRRMIEPSPNCFVMEERASSMFLSRVWAATATAEAFGSAALAGGALDMVAKRGTLVDALISDRRDSKIPIRSRFCSARRPAQAGAGRGRLAEGFRRGRGRRDARARGRPTTAPRGDRTSQTGQGVHRPGPFARWGASTRWRSRRTPPIPGLGRGRARGIAGRSAGKSGSSGGRARRARDGNLRQREKPRSADASRH